MSQSFFLARFLKTIEKLRKNCETQIQQNQLLLFRRNSVNNDIRD